MRTALTNGRILTPDGLAEWDVLVSGDRISAMLKRGERIEADQHIDLDGAPVLPGFIDVQVNGGGGVLFGESPSVAGIRKMAKAHARYGTTGLLPTIISSDLHVIADAIAAVEAAIDEGVPGVLGIHIEGPFLSRERKGIHDASKFRALDDEAVALLTSMRRGKMLVTLAPEETTPERIAQLASAGVLVCAGHTNASYEQTRNALAHGLRGFTHLFNAMSQISPREPGVVGAALDDRNSWCGLIVDKRHVAAAVLRIALRCKGTDKLMLVTDAMPSVGHPEKTFVLQGATIHVENGVCVGPGGTLAGSDLDMAAAVRNTMEELDIDLSAAVHMASRTPAAFLGLEHELGRIAPGYRADFVIANNGANKLDVRSVWIGGRPVYGASDTAPAAMRKEPTS
jgi:N-acetylglucosamine-6-phosphate deacetylase